MSDLGAEVDSSWEACTVAGRRLRAAAMDRRGETARRAMADMDSAAKFIGAGAATV